MHGELWSAEHKGLLLQHQGCAGPRSQHIGDLKSSLYQITHSAGLEEARDAPYLPALSCQPALSFCRHSKSQCLRGVLACRDQDGTAGARRQLPPLPLVPNRAQWHLHCSEGRMPALCLRVAQETGTAQETEQLHI